MIAVRFRLSSVQEESHVEGLHVCLCVSEDSRNALLFAELPLESPLAQPEQGFADGSKMQTLKVSGPRCRNVLVSGILPGPGPGPAVSVSEVGLAAGRPGFCHWFQIDEGVTCCFLTDQTSRCHSDKRQSM